MSSYKYLVGSRIAHRKACVNISYNNAKKNTKIRVIHALSEVRTHDWIVRAVDGFTHDGPLSAIVIDEDKLITYNIAVL
jgi:hypothetical protein